MRVGHVADLGIRTRDWDARGVVCYQEPDADVAGRLCGEGLPVDLGEPFVLWIEACSSTCSDISFEMSLCVCESLFLLTHRNLSIRSDQINKMEMALTMGRGTETWSSGFEDQGFSVGQLWSVPENSPAESEHGL